MNARTLFMLNAILLVMLAISAPFVEVGSGAFVVSIVSLGFISVSLIGLSFVLWRQKQQRQREEVPTEKLR